MKKPSGCACVLTGVLPPPRANPIAVTPSSTRRIIKSSMAPAGGREPAIAVSTASIRPARPIRASRPYRDVRKSPAGNQALIVTRCHVRGAIRRVEYGQYSRGAGSSSEPRPGADRMPRSVPIAMPVAWLPPHSTWLAAVQARESAAPAARPRPRRPGAGRPGEGRGGGAGHPGSAPRAGCAGDRPVRRRGPHRPRQAGTASPATASAARPAGCRWRRSTSRRRPSDRTSPRR